MYSGPTPWQTGSSFKEPVPIPDGGPLDDPQVCFSLARAWLPVVLGALLQLAQPAAWAAADDAARTAVLLDVQDLINAVGTAEECPMLAFRFVACTLQVSYDGGETYTDVPGWDTWAAGCFTGPQGDKGDKGDTGDTGPTGPTGPPGGASTGDPPVQEGTTTAQKACNIAAFLSDQAIKAAVSNVVTSINATANYYNAVVGVVDLFAPLAPELALILTGGSLLVNAITSFTTAPFEAALADDTLWHRVECAIYLAIVADGYVTEGNFDALVAAVRAVTYTDADVIDTIGDYLDGLGWAGVAQLQQTGGYWEGDCSGCGSWCYTFDFTTALAPWELHYTPGADGHWVSGTGVVGDHDGLLGEADIDLSFTATQIDSIAVHFDRSLSDATNDSFIEMRLGGSTVAHQSGYGGVGTDQGYLYTGPGGLLDFIWIRLTQTYAADQPIITSVVLRGPGENPFGANNCA